MQGTGIMDQAQKAAEAAMESMAKGHMPSNVEIMEGLEAWKSGVDADRRRLSTEGELVAQDIDTLVNRVQGLWMEKNSGEQLQKAILHASRAGDIARRSKLATSPVAQAALEDARQGMTSALHVARLMVTSDEFRREVIEAIGIIQQAVRKRTMKKQPTTGEGRTTGNQHIEGGGQMVGEQQQHVGEAEGWTTADESEEEEEETTTEETAGGAAKAITSNYMPLSNKEQDMLAERFFKLVRNLQGKPEHQSGIRFIIDKVHSAYHKGGIVVERMQAELGERAEGRAFLRESQMAKDEALQLVENWTNAPLDPLFQRVNELSDKMRDDDTAQTELHHLAKFVKMSLTGSNITEDEVMIKEEAKQRFSRARDQLMTRHGEPMQRLMDELVYLGEEFRDDEAAQVLKGDTSGLVNHLFFDEQGQPTVKVELIRDLQVLFSALIRKVQWIPIKRVAAVTPDYEVVLDDIMLNLRELTPNQMRLETITNVRDYEIEGGANIRAEVTQTPPGQVKAPVEPIELESFIRIELVGIHSDLRNIKWYYKMKTGMMSPMTDSGFADLKIYGRGMSIFLYVRPSMPVVTRETPVAHSIEIIRCDAKIHKMGLKVWDSKHDWLYSIFTPMIKNQIRASVEHAVADYMKQYLMELDKQVTLSVAGEYPVTKPLSTAGEQQHEQEEYEQSQIESQHFSSTSELPE